MQQQPLGLGERRHPGELGGDRRGDQGQRSRPTVDSNPWKT
jgi:hypothetical protein